VIPSIRDKSLRFNHLELIPKEIQHSWHVRFRIMQHERRTVNKDEYLTAAGPKFEVVAVVHPAQITRGLKYILFVIARKFQTVTLELE
jgi:hypothetical protein